MNAIVDASLPLPLAQLVRRCEHAKSAVERHHNAYYFAEATLKLAASLRIAVWLEHALEPKSALARSLEALVLPSTGHWRDLLRDTDRALAARRDRALLPMGDAVGQLDRQRDWSGVRALAQRAVTSRIVSEDMARSADEEGAIGFFNLLSAYRNDVIGHGGQRRTEFYEAFGELLLAAMAEVVSLPVLFAGARLSAFVRLATDDAGEWRLLAGTQASLFGGLDGAVPHGTCTPGIYALLPGFCVPLRPLAVHRLDDLGNEAVGFLNRAVRRTRRAGDVAIEEVRRVDYLDYATGESFSGSDAEAALTSLLGTLRGRQVTAEELRAAVDVGAAEGAEENVENTVALGAAIADFEIMDELGRGGMGIVYRARQRSLNRVVALKVLSPAIAGDAVALARFRREIAALARCDHPNIVKVLTSGSEGDRHFYAMEYVDGDDLARVERTAPTASRSRDFFIRLAELFADAAGALTHLHERGIVHRDVKPSNLMLTRDGQRVIVMDLGLAQLVDGTEGLTGSDVRVLGTLRYTAPEQLQRRQSEVDHRSDIYGLGATLYELVVGRPIFDGDSEARLVWQILNEEPTPPGIVEKAVPRDLETIISVATAKDPERRYATAAALAMDLRAFARDRPISAGPPSGAHRIALWMRRNRWLAGAFAAIGSVASIGGAAYFDHLRPRQRHVATYSDEYSIHAAAGAGQPSPQRHQSYLLTTRAGRLERVERRNGHGHPATDAQPSILSLVYDDGDAVTAELWSDSRGRLASKRTIVRDQGGLLVSLQDRSSLPSVLPGTEISIIRIEIDPSGRPQREIFLSDRGSPRALGDAYGYQVETDARGLVVARTVLNVDGAPAVDRRNRVRLTYDYDEAGRLVQTACFRADGKPGYCPEGYSILRLGYDEIGNLVDRRFLDRDGKAMAGSDGYARQQIHYDASGDPVLAEYFDALGARVRSADGFASWSARYDDRGRMIEVSFSDVDGKPATVEDGYASRRTAWDERGNPVEMSFWGPDGAPCVLDDGYSAFRASYDERDNQTAMVLLGPDSKPALHRDGYASWYGRYDARDRLVEITFAGVDGSPAPCSAGYVGARYQYDEQGRPVEITYTGADGGKVMTGAGYATERMSYTDRGDLSVAQYLDTHGELVVNRERYASWRAAYDKSQNQIATVYLDIAGRPTVSSRGYAFSRTQYGGLGQGTHRSHFTPEGRLVATPGVPTPPDAKDPDTVTSLLALFDPPEPTKGDPSAEAMRAIWNRVASVDTDGRWRMHFEDRNDIVYLYSVGFVDEQRWKLLEWVAAFERSRLPDGGYSITEEEWMKKTPFRYDGPVGPPWDATLIRDGEWTEEEWREFFRGTLLPQCYFNEEELQAIVDEAKDDKAFFENGRYHMTPAIKADLLQMIESYPSPRRVRELEAQASRMEAAVTKVRDRPLSVGSLTAIVRAPGPPEDLDPLIARPGQSAEVRSSLRTLRRAIAIFAATGNRVAREGGKDSPSQRLEHDRSAVAAAERLAELDPATLATRRMLASATARLADTLQALGRAEDADQVGRRCLAVREQIVASHGADLADRISLARSVLAVPSSRAETDIEMAARGRRAWTLLQPAEELGRLVGTGDQALPLLAGSLLPEREQMALYQYLASRRPKDLDVANSLGWVLILLGHHTDARAHFEALVSSTPSDSQQYPFFLGNLANAELLSGDIPRALEHYQKLMQYPKFVDYALNDLAEFRRRKFPTRGFAEAEALLRGRR